MYNNFSIINDGKKYIIGGKHFRNRKLY